MPDAIQQCTSIAYCDLSGNPSLQFSAAVPQLARAIATAERANRCDGTKLRRETAPAVQSEDDSSPWHAEIISTTERPPSKARQGHSSHVLFVLLANIGRIEALNSGCIC